MTRHFITPEESKKGRDTMTCRSHLPRASRKNLGGQRRMRQRIEKMKKKEGRVTKRARENAEQKAWAQNDCDICGTSFLRLDIDDGMEKWTRIDPTTVMISLPRKDK